MRIHKRKKNTRYRGSQTHRRGHRKRTKGSGNRGGKGMSGSENQRKSWIINQFGMEYFGRDKALRRGIVAPKLKVINLDDLIKRFDSLIKQGIAKQTQKGFEFNLHGYKLLAGTGANAKISVKASAASKSAIAQIKAAGGSIVLEAEEKDKSENKEEKLEKKEKQAIKK